MCCKLTILFSPSGPPVCEVLFIIPALQKRKSRPGHINYLAQGHRTNPRWKGALPMGLRMLIMCGERQEEDSELEPRDRFRDEQGSTVGW